MVHSKEDLEFAQQASNILFGKDTTEALAFLNEKQLLEVMEGVPQVTFNKQFLKKVLTWYSFLQIQVSSLQKEKQRKCCKVVASVSTKQKRKAEKFFKRGPFIE